MKTTANLLILIAIVTLANPSLATTTLRVNCDRGKTIESALRRARAGHTIRVRGVCQETVTITTDGLTLDGQGSAIIAGQGADAVTVDGAHRVTIKGFEIREGRNGLIIKGGASAMLHDTVVKENTSSGILIDGNSSLDIMNSVTETNGLFGISIDRASELRISGEFNARRNGVFGMIFGNNSSGTFTEAQIRVNDNILGIQVGINSSVLIADAATMVDTSNNLTTGFTVVAGSTLFVFEGHIESNSNRLNHGVSANSNSNIDLDRGGSITVGNNGQDGIQLENSALNLFNMPGLRGSAVETRNNGRHGLSAFLESQIDLSIDSVVTSQGNTMAGLRADNGSAIRVINSQITNNNPDAELSFAARAELNGNTIGTITCDGSVLIRGDVGVTCPAP